MLIKRCPLVPNSGTLHGDAKTSCETFTPLLAALIGAAISNAICSMVPGGGGRHRPPFHPDPRGNACVPPSWTPEHEETYPFRQWMHDIVLWSMATDLTAQQQAPMIVLSLGGSARMSAM